MVRRTTSLSIGSCETCRPQASTRRFHKVSAETGRRTIGPALTICSHCSRCDTGCFENYLGVKQLTDTWPRINEAGDWLFLYDRLDGRLRSDRDYELLGYVPYTFVPWYKLFSSHTSAQMEFPKADYEVGSRALQQH